MISAQRQQLCLAKIRTYLLMHTNGVTVELESDGEDLALRFSKGSVSTAAYTVNDSLGRVLDPEDCFLGELVDFAKLRLDDRQVYIDAEKLKESCAKAQKDVEDGRTMSSTAFKHRLRSKKE